jgi:hypothetical protein
VAFDGVTLSAAILGRPAHNAVYYSCLTYAPPSIATNSACASAISGISGVGAKPSSAGARTACRWSQIATKLSADAEGHSRGDDRWRVAVTPRAIAAR